MRWSNLSSKLFKNKHQVLGDPDHVHSMHARCTSCSLPSTRAKRTPTSAWTNGSAADAAGGTGWTGPGAGPGGGAHWPGGAPASARGTLKRQTNTFN